MGTTYFVIFIASIVVSVIVLLLKIFLENTLAFKDYSKALDEQRVFDRNNEVEHRRFEVYSHNYMVELEQARCKKVQRKKTVDAFM